MERGYMFSKGATYDGEWKEGVFHGDGNYVYANGDHFEGEFKNGKFNGFGRYTTSAGNTIEGEFEAGKPIHTTVETEKPEISKFDQAQKERFDKWKEENFKKIEARKRIRQMAINK